MSFQRRLLATATLGILAAPRIARSQAFPGRPLRLVVPFPPGGASDIIGRQLAASMSETLGQPVIVDNRPGANTAIGAETVARAAPDGLTMLLVTSTTLAIAPHLPTPLPYRVDQFAQVGLVVKMPFVMVSSPLYPPATMQAVIADARARPGAVNFASHGRGGSAHLVGELWRMAAGVDIVAVHYTGNAPATVDLIANRVQLMFDGTPTALAASRSGQLRALAIMSDRRSPAAPDLPTMAEAGLPGVTAYSWYGLSVPAATPEPIVARLDAAVTRAVADPTVRARFIADGLEPGDLDRAGFNRMVSAESETWRRVITSIRGQIE
ncbi:tripartite tricarboxylate transporter substrate binding protein [Roseomonas sp. CAU 1739]|uniref:Bug family tripartite tricarboxylate transporter substrate binding protein n=1 Tax=Roseomonas sp. CAU 1739 TaxID=3140364 RepID=UPI00325B1C47